MATRQQQNTTPIRTISDFKSRLSGGGARPNLFEVELAFPNAVAIEMMSYKKQDFLLRQLHYQHLQLLPLMFHSGVVF